MNSEILTQIFIRVMRIESAKEFLKTNLIETVVCAVRIYDLVIFTLRNSINRDKELDVGISSKQRGGHNKVMQKHETDALHEFIRSLLSYDIPPTHELVFNAISALKLAEKRDSSSRR
jgi:hypothetical protein